MNQCLKCKNETFREENFLDISISITNQQNQKFDTLHECLENFFNEEMMEESSQIYCEKCKSKTNFMKKTFIKKPPNVLILHLCRFSYDLKKLNHNVEIPTILHLNRFSIKNDKISDAYELKCVIHHFGNLFGGHYVGSCKDENDDWIVYDDTNVKNVKNIQSPSNYVLFYVKKR